MRKTLRSYRSACLILAGLALLSSAVFASEWNVFRGPNSSGISRSGDYPVQFGPETNVAWKAEAPEGHSSPVFGDELIFLTGFDDENLYIIALRRDTGEIAWNKAVRRPRKGEYHDDNTPASPSPATDGRNVYVFFNELGLVSYDAWGAERWRVELGPFNNPFGLGASPVLAGDKVIMVCDAESGSFMVAVDKDTGELAWRNEREFVRRGFSTPVLYEPEEGGLQVLVPGSYQLIAYDVETGEKVWWVRGLTWQLKPTPVMDEDTIYVQCWAGGADYGNQEEVPGFEETLAAHDANGDGLISKEETPDPSMAGAWDNYDLDRDGFLGKRDWEQHRLRKSSVNSIQAIRLGGQGDMTETAIKWRYYKSLPNVPSPLLYQGVLYMMKEGGILTALDPETGKVLKQGRLRHALDRYFAAPVAAAGKLYVVSETGTLTVLKAGADWEVLEVNEFNEPVYATPALVDGRIYLRTKSALYCFGSKTS